MTNLLNTPEFPIIKFHWMPEHRLFVAEASDLGPVTSQMFGQVYKDACDEGLTVISRFTDTQPVRMVVTHTEIRDGDLLYWDLSPASQTGPMRNPPWSLRIYND